MNEKSEITIKEVYKWISLMWLLKRLKKSLITSKKGLKSYSLKIKDFPSYLKSKVKF